MRGLSGGQLAEDVTERSVDDADDGLTHQHALEGLVAR
jgi:hypothetical protein